MSRRLVDLSYVLDYKDMPTFSPSPGTALLGNAVNSFQQHDRAEQQATSVQKVSVPSI